jgi:hypothetical protein
VIRLAEWWMGMRCLRGYRGCSVGCTLGDVQQAGVGGTLGGLVGVSPMATLGGCVGSGWSASIRVGAVCGVA